MSGQGRGATYTAIRLTAVVDGVEGEIFACDACGALGLDRSSVDHLSGCDPDDVRARIARARERYRWVDDDHRWRPAPARYADGRLTPEERVGRARYIIDDRLASRDSTVAPRRS